MRREGIFCIVDKGYLELVHVDSQEELEEYPYWISVEDIPCGAYTKPGYYWVPRNPNVITVKREQKENNL